MNILSCSVKVKKCIPWLLIYFVIDVQKKDLFALKFIEMSNYVFDKNVIYKR